MQLQALHRQCDELTQRKDEIKALNTQRSQDAVLSYPELPSEFAQVEKLRRGLLSPLYAQNAVMANALLERAFQLATILEEIPAVAPPRRARVQIHEVQERQFGNFAPSTWYERIRQPNLRKQSKPQQKPNSCCLDQEQGHWANECPYRKRMTALIQHLRGQRNQGATHELKDDPGPK